MPGNPTESKEVASRLREVLLGYLQAAGSVAAESVGPELFVDVIPPGDHSEGLVDSLSTRVLGLDVEA